jgi:hypothetical protein
VYAQRYDAAGVTQGGEFQVSLSTTADQVVAMSADGDFVIAWTSNGPDVDIYAQRYDDAGAPQGSEFRVNSFTTSGQTRPAVAMDSAGDCVIVWQGDGANGYALYAQRYSPTGALLGEEFNIAGGYNPSVASDSAGNFVVAFNDGGAGIYARRFNATGVAQGTAQFVGGGGAEPSPAIDADGDFVIAWTSFYDGSNSGIYARRYNAAGLPQGAGFRVNTYTTGNQLRPCAAMDPSGDFVVAWDSYGQDGGRYGIYSQRYTVFDPSDVATVGGIVWSDENGNGIRNKIDQPIAFAPVEIYNGAGAFIASTYTDEAGLYSFTVRAGAAVYLHFPTPVPYLQATLKDKGGNDQRDSDVDPATGSTSVLAMGVAGTTNDSVSAGFILPAYLGGIVFLDRNGDGIRNGSEQPLAGFEVFADLDHDGTLDANEPAAISDIFGVYQLENLAPGDYPITIVEQDLWSEPAPLTVNVPVGATLSGVNLPVRTTAHDIAAEPQGEEFHVNTYTSANQGIAAVAMDADGDFVVTWQSFGQTGYGGSSDVYAQRYDASGEPQGNEFRVNTFTPNFQGLPAVAMNGDGDFVITWTSLAQNGPFYGVYAQRYNAAGQPQGGEIYVNGVPNIGEGESTVAIDAEGNFVIAWSSFGRDGDGFSIFAQRFDAVGIPQGGAFQANTFTGAHQRLPSVAMDRAGDFVVAWQSVASGFQDGSDYGIYAQRYDASGTAEGTEFRVNTFTTNRQFLPAVAMDAAGDFVITWTSLGQDSSFYGVYAQRYNAAGVRQGGEFRVHTSIFSGDGESSIAMDEDGDFVIAWSSFGKDGNGFGAFAQRYNAAGVPQEQHELQVNSNTLGHQRLPAVAMDAAGDFVVAWQDSSQEQLGGYGIYAQRFFTSARPAVSSGQFVWQDAPQRIEFTFDQDVSASLSGADFVLENFTTGETIPASSMVVNWNGVTQKATLTFPTLANGGSLPDGDYRVTLLGSGVTNASGTQLVGDCTLDFFALAGDADHDRDVDVADLDILASNWQQSPRTFGQGDFNYDGTVDVTDLGILASNWQHQPATSQATLNNTSRRLLKGGRISVEVL